MEYIFNNKYIFLFVLMRLSVIMTFGLFFGDKRINKKSKFALIFLITMIVAPTIKGVSVSNLSQFEFASILFKEFLIGLSIAMVSNMIIQCLSMAGSLIDIQGGFGMAQVFDPATQSQSSLVSQLMVVIGTLCLIGNDLHITFLNIIIDSFVHIPIGSNVDYIQIIQLICKCISIAGCIALPVIGIIFMIDVILGISTKTMPQLNLFSVGFIIKIFATTALMFSYSMILNKITIYLSEIVFGFITKM